MYTYCLILRWGSFKQRSCVYFIYCIFWFVFLVCKFEKEKKSFKIKKKLEFTASLLSVKPN